MRAVDVVLFPPMDVMKRIIEWNKDLKGEYPTLNAEDRIPHLSLAMGGMGDERIPQVAELLKELAAEFLPLPLTVTGTGQFGSVTGLAIERSPQLESLHKTVMERIAGGFESKVTKKMFFEDGDIGSVKYVNSFRENSSFNKFSPHITLGLGTKNVEGFTFKTSMIAICQLGRHCTCRKILAIAGVEG